MGSGREPGKYHTKDLKGLRLWALDRTFLQVRIENENNVNT